MLSLSYTPLNTSAVNTFCSDLVDNPIVSRQHGLGQKLQDLGNLHYLLGLDHQFPISKTIFLKYKMIITTLFFPGEREHAKESW